MSTASRRVFLACLALHLTLIFLVCVHETFWLLKRDVVTIMGVHPSAWESLDRIPETILGAGGSSSRDFWNTTVATYTNAAGIEVGYGYFAPNLPAASALVFECHYRDGRVEYEKPSLEGDAGQLRVSTLVDQIDRTDYDRWRIALIKLLARSNWKRHPDAVMLRAFFGRIDPPTMVEYRAGKREETFTCLYVYDFRRETPAGEKPRL